MVLKSVRPGEPVPHRQPLLLPAGAPPARNVVVQVCRSVCTPGRTALASILLPAAVPPGVTPPRHFALALMLEATSASLKAFVLDVPSARSAVLWAILCAKTP